MIKVDIFGYVSDASHILYVQLFTISFIQSSFIIHTIKRSKYTIRILLEVGESDKGLDVSGPLGFISASYWVILIKSARFSFHDFQTIIHSAKYGVHGPASILNQV